MVNKQISNTNIWFVCNSSDKNLETDRDLSELSDPNLLVLYKKILDDLLFFFKKAFQFIDFYPPNCRSTDSNTAILFHFFISRFKGYGNRQIKHLFQFIFTIQYIDILFLIFMLNFKKKV